MNRPAPSSFTGTVTDDGSPPTSTSKIRPWLTVLDGPDRARHLEIGEVPRNLGRGPGADLLLLDERISRIHCTVGVSADGRVEVVDVGSRNGTYIDEAKISRAFLQPDSRLRIGQTVLQVQYKDPAQVQMEEEVFRAVVTDPLTGIPNRRGFAERAASLLAASARHRFPLSAVFVDLDRFKEMNDIHGHAAGDEVLREAAKRLDATRRAEDLLCRYGGEEFVLLLPYTGLDQACTFAERARKAVGASLVDHAGQCLSITASFGVAVFQVPDTLESLLERADRALYEAKSRGRNRVEKADEALPSSGPTTSRRG